MKILNLTQHIATPEQLAAGVEEPNNYDKEQIRQLLTFDTLPSQFDIVERATRLADLVRFEYRLCGAAMIGGAPFLMGPLEVSLKTRFIKPLYAFSIRESIEKTNNDGSVIKTNVFKHIGFVNGVNEINWNDYKG